MTMLSANELLTRPFEAHYRTLGVKMYQFMARPDAASIDDIGTVEINMGDAQGITFRSENRNGAELLCTVWNDFQQIIPAWFEMIAENQCEINWTEKFSVLIDDENISFVYDENDRDNSEEVHMGTSFAVYLFDDDHSADYLILDADGERIKVSQNGYALNENGDEIESNFIFDCDSLAGEFYDHASDASSEAADFSSMEAINAMKQSWINRELSKFLQEKALTVAEDSE